MKITKVHINKFRGFHDQEFEVGRKSSPDKYKLSGKKVLVKGLLEEGISHRKIAKICEVDRNTLARFIKFRALND